MVNTVFADIAWDSMALPAWIQAGASALLAMLTAVYVVLTHRLVGEARQQSDTVRRVHEAEILQRRQRAVAALRLELCEMAEAAVHVGQIPRAFSVQGWNSDKGDLPPMVPECHKALFDAYCVAYQCNTQVVAYERSQEEPQAYAQRLWGDRVKVLPEHARRALRLLEAVDVQSIGHVEPLGTGGH